MRRRKNPHRENDLMVYGIVGVLAAGLLGWLYEKATQK